MSRVIIIGGGAAGAAAAIAAAQKGEEVLVLERNRRLLKKLGVTGNGRGNLLNCGQPVYYGDEAFALEVLRHMPYEQIAAFLENCGIPLVHEAEGRMYPSSYLAASAVDALCLQMRRLGVKTEENTRAVRIEKNAKGFCVYAKRAVYAPDTVLKSGRVKPGALLGEEDATFSAERVVVTVGGAASPMHGTDGTGYALLSGLGHTLVEPRPALCALLTETRPIEGLSGQRVRAALSLDGHRSRGEALFAEDGVSGIAAMQLARFAVCGSMLEMDLREAVMGSEGDVQKWLEERIRLRADLPLSELLTGAASPALSRALLRRAGLQPRMPAQEADAASISRLAQVISRFTLRVEGTRGLDSAQVTAGGIAPAEFDPATMESRLVPGLYAAGEVLDVDGGCGGFNLMFAFASGLLSSKG